MRNKEIQWKKKEEQMKTLENEVETYKTKIDNVKNEVQQSDISRIECNQKMMQMQQRLETYEND